MTRITMMLLVALSLASGAWAQTPPPGTPTPAAPAPAATTPKPPPAATPASSVRFKDEASAKAHCPTDTVVWLNVAAKVYHLSGTRYYGTTKKGVYICKQDADHLGYRVARGELVKTPAPAAATKP